MKNSKTLLEDIVKNAIENIFSNKIEVEIREGIALRTIEIPESVAEMLGYKNGEIVEVKTEGTKAVIFKNVKIFVNKDIIRKRFFINPNEAKAANLEDGFIVEILKEKQENSNKKIKEELSYRFEKDGIYTKLI